MKPVADVVLSPPFNLSGFHSGSLRPPSPSFAGIQSLDWQLARVAQEKFDAYWATQKPTFLPPDIYGRFKEAWLDLGAGTGGFFLELSARHPDILFVPVERCKTRGKTLARRTKKFKRDNFLGIRGNVVAHIASAIPAASLDRIYILYPCPWVKNSQRKNRWFLHPIMPHIVRALKPGGLLVWASDQRFYIEEARYVCGKKYPLEEISFGPLAPNEINLLADFPQGRTKFEADFLGQQQPCFELIVRKNAD